jgi:hypothetical protein
MPAQARNRRDQARGIHAIMEGVRNRIGVMRHGSAADGSRQLILPSGRRAVIGQDLADAGTLDGATVRPPYPRVTAAFTGQCLMRPGRRRTRGMAPPQAREHDPPGTAYTGGPGHTQTRFTVPSRSPT